MKFYIAARFSLKDEVREIYKTLEDKGHSITADWTQHKRVKPYHENMKLAKEYAIEDMKGSMECDVFILISSDAGTGMYVELGAAIAQQINTGKPKIYTIGDNTTRSPFHLHPAVKRMKSFEEVQKDLRI